MKIALQMYTIRDAVKTGEDLLSALEKVRGLGYEGVEFAGYFGIEAQMLKKALADVGLHVVASHESLEAMENRADELISYAKTLGNKNLVLAYSPAQTMEEVDHVIKVLSEIHKKAAAQGINVLYHNHSHEFEDVGGTLPIDRIRETCPLEADTYWVFNAGRKPGEFLRGHADQIGLIHLKDGDLEGNPCAIGEGKNEIAAILDAARDIGAEWVIVENDYPKPDGFSDITRSREYLRRECGV